MEPFQDQIGRFVERRRRAVAEGEAGGAEARDSVAQPVTRRSEEFEALVRLGQGDLRAGDAALGQSEQ